MGKACPPFLHNDLSVYFKKVSEIGGKIESADDIAIARRLAVEQREWLDLLKSSIKSYDETLLKD